MRAAVVREYGRPGGGAGRGARGPRPGPKDVLVRVRATAVTSGDARIRGARVPRGFAPFARLALGIRRPRVGPSWETPLRGRRGPGPKVTGVAVSDEVAGATAVRMGTHAELVVVRGSKVVPLPAGVSHDDAAGVLFGGTTALVYLRDKATVRPREARSWSSVRRGAIGTTAV